MLLAADIFHGVSFACEASTLIALSLVLSAASTGIQYTQQQRAADKQEDLAEAQAQFERDQAAQQAREAAQQAAEERQALAEEAARARGVAKTSGLGDRSVNAFLRDISRREGRSDAIIDRNLEIIASRRRAQNRATSLSLAGKNLGIEASRPSGAVTGLTLGTDLLAGGLQIRQAQKQSQSTT